MNGSGLTPLSPLLKPRWGGDALMIARGKPLPPLRPSWKRKTGSGWLH